MDFIKDVNGKVLGRIEDRPGVGQRVYSPNGAMLGTYNASMNQTQDRNGMMSTSGNTLGMFLKK